MVDRAGGQVGLATIAGVAVDVVVVVCTLSVTRIGTFGALEAVEVAAAAAVEFALPAFPPPLLLLPLLLFCFLIHGGILRAEDDPGFLALTQA